MKKILTWLAVGLPWIAGIGLLFAFCLQSYFDGKTFAQGLHALGWLAKVFLGAFVYFPALLIATIVTVATRRQRGNWRSLRLPILIVGTSLVVPLLAMPAISYSFFAGRDVAYRSINYQAVYEACVGLRNRALQSGTDFGWWRAKGGEDDLAPAIRRLTPLGVYVTSHAVAIQMDGGGPMYHEGIGVILTEDGTRSLPKDGIRPLHDSLPVYLYRLYDFRIFLDSVEEGEPDAPADADNPRR